MNAAVEAEMAIREEIESAARQLAAQGKRGQAGDPLPLGMSVRAFTRINADPTGFFWRVWRHREQMYGKGF